MKRDCKTCVYSNMTEYSNGCTQWTCEYINVEEAVEAWKEKYKKVEPQPDCPWK